MPVPDTRTNRAITQDYVGVSSYLLWSKDDLYDGVVSGFKAIIGVGGFYRGD